MDNDINNDDKIKSIIIVISSCILCKYVRLFLTFTFEYNVLVFETFFLKGPKREMFVAEIFTEIRPVWLGDLETRPKNLKKFMFGALYYPLFPGIFV